MPRRAATGNSPHNRDEIYVIVTGSGYFVDAGTRQTVTAGTCILVPARANHRFEDFTDDFSTWVFFYGPAGGEAKAAS